MTSKISYEITREEVERGYGALSDEQWLVLKAVIEEGLEIQAEFYLEETVEDIEDLVIEYRNQGMNATNFTSSTLPISRIEKEWDNPDDAIYDALDKGYELLAKDPEIPSRRKYSHHCGFDFKPNQTLAKCSCGKVSTNPYFRLPISQGETE